MTQSVRFRSPKSRALPGLAAMLCAMVWLAACVPTSVHPLRVEGQPVVDQELLGTWRGEVGEQDSLLLFLNTRAENDTEGMTLLVATPVQPAAPPEGAEEADDADAGWLYALALSAQIGGHRFLSVDWRGDGGDAVEGTQRGWHLYRYELSPETGLAIYGLNEVELKAAVDRGEIEAVETGSGIGKEIRLTASPADLAAWIAASDPLVLFTETVAELTRLP
ncbi:MAG: hypothetical protein HXY25_09575 [Alphaproteobacteria bacterium]|nr:hypothetical protein [Alphaproteobacteria bacterium]